MASTGFDRPTLQDLREEGRTEVASRLGYGALLPRSVLGVLSDVGAAGVHGIHGHLAYLARQIIPDTADTVHLDRWAAVFGVARKAGTTATGSVTFTGTDPSSIPAGTKVRRSDGVEYTTDAVGTLASGTATIAVTADKVGAIGDAATGTTLTLTSPVTGVDATATVATPGLANGADAETDALLRARLLLRIQATPMGGSASDYVAWALQVAGVTRAWAVALFSGPGTVRLFFAVDTDPDGPIPDAAQVAAVLAFVDPLRPVTAVLTVAAPVAKNLDPDITLTPDTGLVRQAVQDSIDDLLLREAAPGTVLLVSHVREAISNAAGETNHVLNSLAGVTPAADVTPAAGELLVRGTITWS